MKLFNKYIIKWADRQIEKEQGKPETDIDWNKIARLNHIAARMERPWRNREEEISRANALWEKISANQPKGEDEK